MYSLYYCMVLYCFINCTLDGGTLAQHPTYPRVFNQHLLEVSFDNKSETAVSETAVSQRKYSVLY